MQVFDFFCVYWIVITLNIKKRMKFRMIFMALAALLCLASCSDDDSGIQLTEDEVAGDYSDGESIFKDVTDNYKKTFPHIKKVELQAICAIEELEPVK